MVSFRSFGFLYIFCFPLDLLVSFRSFGLFLSQRFSVRRVFRSKVGRVRIWSLKRCSKNKHRNIVGVQNVIQAHCNILSSKTFKVDLKAEECTQKLCLHILQTFGEKLGVERCLVMSYYWMQQVIHQDVFIPSFVSIGQTIQNFRW